MMKTPKTTQELRASISIVKSDSFKIRSKRNQNNLPQAWDDVERQKSRSWKDYRKDQWKSG